MPGVRGNRDLPGSHSRRACGACSPAWHASSCTCHNLRELTPSARDRPKWRVASPPCSSRSACALSANVQ